MVANAPASRTTDLLKSAEEGWKVVLMRIDADKLESRTPFLAWYIKNVDYDEYRVTKVEVARFTLLLTNPAIWDRTFPPPSQGATRP